MSLTQPQMTDLEKFLYGPDCGFGVNAKVMELAEYLDRHFRERRQTAYGMDREGMQAAALVVNAQAKAFEDALEELLRLMRHQNDRLTDLAAMYRHSMEEDVSHDILLPETAPCLPNPIAMTRGIRVEGVA